MPLPRSSYRPLSREQMRAIAANPQYAPPPEATRQGFYRNMYAGEDVAGGLARMMGGTVWTSQASGGIDLPEHGIQFSNGEGNAPSEVLNAGLLQDRIAQGVGRGENPDYINAAIRDQVVTPAGVRNTPFGVQPTSGAMTSADAERLYGGDPRFDPNVRVQPREIPNYRMGAGGLNHGPTGVGDGPSVNPNAVLAPQPGPRESMRGNVAASRRMQVPLQQPQQPQRQFGTGNLHPNVIGGGIVGNRPLTPEQIREGRETISRINSGRAATMQRMGWADNPEEEQLRASNPVNTLRGGSIGLRGSAPVAPSDFQTWRTAGPSRRSTQSIGGATTSYGINRRPIPSRQAPRQFQQPRDPRIPQPV